MLELKGKFAKFCPTVPDLLHYKHNDRHRYVTDYAIKTELQKNETESSQKSIKYYKYKTETLL